MDAWIWIWMHGYRCTRNGAPSSADRALLRGGEAGEVGVGFERCRGRRRWDEPFSRLSRRARRRLAQATGQPGAAEERGGWRAQRTELASLLSPSSRRHRSSGRGRRAREGSAVEGQVSRAGLSCCWATTPSRERLLLEAWRGVGTLPPLVFASPVPRPPSLDALAASSPPAAASALVSGLLLLAEPASTLALPPPLPRSPDPEHLQPPHSPLLDAGATTTTRRRSDDGPSPGSIAAHPLSPAFALGNPPAGGKQSLVPSSSPAEGGVGPSDHQVCPTTGQARYASTPASGRS